MSKTLLIFIPLILSTVSACISVKLSPSEGSKRAVGVRVTEPGRPFVKQEREDVDAAWKNEANGNTISYLSDCKDPSDPALDYVIQGIISGISELKVESRDTVSQQSREGRRVVATGKVDGVPTQMDLLVYKRNQCIYILSYLGVKDSFGADRDHFNKFISGFIAP